ncbi:hypothetical protein GYMLUDRAFT_44643 [Collybiopsis luxurians FD-317 M1]|uniref:F-box domain-containing protein n=1 Tax=Collybiopsis luxurians FD-317 M1 TaxID=944289 RepID=A0A0D0CL59_9AGAR|nr:hypothetical protein GYMLUDRAFT_44643 [Collybiopsis luxurians FD-317 M1]
MQSDILLHATLTEKCRSNYIPATAVELAQLKSSVQSTRSALETCTDDDTRSRTQLSKILQLQESLLSPIRTLPPEILSEIFSHFIKPLNFAFSKVQASVFTLTWVCCWWRNHAISQTKLWSSYIIGGLWDSNPNVDWLLKECISRSGTHGPLNVAIMARDKSFDTELWAPLLEHTMRWRSLRLITVDLSALHYFLHVLENSQEDHSEGEDLKTTTTTTTHFPRLENLTLAMPIPANIDQLPHIPLSNLFSACPSIHALRIPYLRSSDILNFTHLTSLYIDECYQGGLFATLLAECPLLRTCTVGRFITASHLTQPSSSAPIPIPRNKTVTHTNLTTLHLTWFDKNCTVGFFQHVMLPKLTSLLVSINGYQIFKTVNRPDPLVELKTMIIESKCTLRKVHLGKSIPRNAVISFFEGLDIVWGGAGNGNVVVNGAVYERNTSARTVA